MSNIAIKVENLSKIYRLGEIGTGTISRDMERWFKTRILKKEDPFLKIGETNDRANKGASDIVYSLQDINFEINQGDAVGIIGRNGAGKSTLLKILSRVTTPTTGKINIKGRVASLLEVGTGFHPELTGRENIYLNGAILGMRKREIDRKLDEIIDFSGVERYIDTPVKRYSSGMYVRLAFAVTAYLDSEILIIDEVLAVGDAEFQKKCLTKMNEVGQKEGRTVLFVSHDMNNIKLLCKKGILLANGTTEYIGDIDSVIEKYTEFQISNLNTFREINSGLFDFTLLSLGIKNENDEHSDLLFRTKNIYLYFNFINKTSFSGLYFNIKFKNFKGEYLITTNSMDACLKFTYGKGIAKMVIPAHFFNVGIFSMDLMILNFESFSYKSIFEKEDILSFEIIDESKEIGSWAGKEKGYIRNIFEWTI